MSKVWKGIKKAFKAVLKIVKVIAIIVVIAAAIYFTAGAASAAFGAAAAGATTGFAASAATFFGTVQATIGAWGAALWTSAVSAFTGAAPAAGTGLTASSTFNPALAGIGTTGATSTVAPVAASTLAASETGAVAASLSAGASGSGGGLIAKMGTSLKDMSVTDKLLLAKTATDTIGGFTAPTEREKAEAERTHVGAFYGRNADGSGGGVVDIGSGGAEQVFTPERPAPAPSAQALFNQRTNVATNPEGKVFNPVQAATKPQDLFQPQGA